MINSSADAGIPLLTEILAGPPAEPVRKNVGETATAARPAGELENTTTDAPAAVFLTPPFSEITTEFCDPTAPATSAARAAPAMNFGATDLSIDFDIPELLFPVSVEPALISSTPSLAASPSSVSPSSASPSPLSASSPSLANHTVSSAEWEQLEADITERISRQVLGRIDFVLEQRVRDSLADVLQIAVEGLAQEIKRGLHQTLEDVIGRAVAQEIARLQTSKN